VSVPRPFIKSLIRCTHVSSRIKTKNVVAVRFNEKALC
jgi:hypothetical protein